MISRTYLDLDPMALKLLNILIVMGKKLLFLIAAFLLSTLPAYSEEGNLFSKIGIQSIKDKRKTLDFCLQGLNGDKVQLAALKGKIIFLNFWASWCGPCKEEMPSMEALYQHFKERDFVLLSISVDYGGPDPVRKLIEKHRYRFPVLLDPAGKTLDLFEISKIPAMLIIDRRGKMIGRVIGSRNWSSPEVFSLVDQLLNDPPGKVASVKNNQP
jgi:peroxiredoxin